ncbi:MAG: carboxypeptidase regulatory-like domain-containing protein, partial [Deltaproteobacteria bacterium]|nr:carboxypeptidase regulatory-like domain-containing protein [Deltaproteobacteria bacterium]
VRVEPGAGGVPLLITLDTQGTPLAGFVLGPSGEEVAGAIVVVQGAGGLSTQVTSSSSGDFRLDSPPPPPWTVTVTAAGAARWQRQVPRLDGPLEVNLEAGGSLRLEVLEEGTFEPLSQVRVALRGPEQLQWSGRLANGYLAIDQLRPGRYTVEVEARGHLPGRREGVPVEDRRDPDPVRLLLARGGGLAGTVLDLEGSPLGGAEVRASPKSTASGARPLTVRTNATGAFRLSPLAEGPVELNVAAPGYEPDVRTERVVAGEDFTDLEFRLVPIW